MRMYTTNTEPQMDEGEVYRDGGDAARGRGGGRPRKCK